MTFRCFLIFRFLVAQIFNVQKLALKKEADDCKNKIKPITN